MFLFYYTYSILWLFIYLKKNKTKQQKLKTKQELIASHCNTQNMLGTEQLWRMKPLSLRFYSIRIVRKKWKVEGIYQDLLVSF